MEQTGRETWVISEVSAFPIIDTATSGPMGTLAVSFLHFHQQMVNITPYYGETYETAFPELWPTLLWSWD